MKLSLELVPAYCFYDNVRKLLTKEQWSIISRQVRSEAYDICQICHSSEEDFLDCHEVWFYNEHTSTQKLIKLEALCKKCHGVKHFGLSQLQGKREEALAHFMEVNNLTEKKAEEAIKKSFEVWQKRSQKQWKLDVSLLGDFGIDLSKVKVKK